MSWLKGLGILLIMISTLCGWINAPLSGNILIPEFKFIVILLVILFASAIILFRSNTFSFLVGIVCLYLVVFFLLHLLLNDSIIWQLSDENTQYANIIKFAEKYYPPNFGRDPNAGKQLMTSTLVDRMGMVFYFIDRGWWLCLFGSLILILGSVFIKPVPPKILLVPVLLPFCMCIILSNAIYAQYIWEQAINDMGQGKHASAIRIFEKIIASGTQLSGSDTLYLCLGKAYYHMGRSNLPGALFYKGVNYEEKGDFERALSEYRIASYKSELQLKQVIFRRMARLYIKQGLQVYDNGLLGNACSQWEAALSCNPRQYEAIFYLTKGYFDQGKYKKSIEMADLLLTKLKNELLRADILSNMGDGYWKLLKFNNARQVYEKSIKIDEYGNLRIFKNLGGT